MKTSRFICGLIACLVLLVSACASKPLSIKPDLQVAELGICIDFNEHIEDDEKLLYLNAAKQLVDNKRDKGHFLKLEMCKNTQTHKVNFMVQNTRFIDPSEQALYVLLSTAGILYPLSGGQIGFAWLGFNTSNIELSASPSISDEARPVYTQVYSSPYFLSAEAVRLKHMESFKEFVVEVVKGIEQKLQQNVAKSQRELKI